MEGKLIYALIVRDQETILCDYTKASGNFEQRIMEVVGNINPKVRETCLLGNFNFHSTGLQRYLFVCMADKQYPSRVAFKFLQELQDSFYQHINETDRENANAFGLNKNFRKVIKEKLEHYNTLDADNLMKVQAAVRDVQNVMIKNLDMVIDNNIKIEILQDKAVAMKMKSEELKKNSRKVYCIQCTRNFKITLILIITVILAAWLIFSLICGFNFHCISN
ncbi:hypothetical protein ABPG74_001334 [Tetrahymena malaccensis]